MIRAGVGHPTPAVIGKRVDVGVRTRLANGGSIPHEGKSFAGTRSIGHI